MDWSALLVGVIGVSFAMSKVAEAVGSRFEAYLISKCATRLWCGR